MHILVRVVSTSCQKGINGNGIKDENILFSGEKNAQEMASSFTGRQYNFMIKAIDFGPGVIF